MAGVRRSCDHRVVHPPSITVAIGDDAPAVRAALEALIAAEPGLELVGSGGDAEAIVSLCAALQPAVAIVDVKMPKGGGVAATAAIRSMSPDTTVIAFTAEVDRGTRRALAAAGAHAVIDKAGPISLLLDAIAAASMDPSQG